MKQEHENEVIAMIMWFNGAKGIGFARAIDDVLDDIRLESSVVKDKRLLRDDRVLVKYKQDLIGLVATDITLLDKDETS